MKLSNICIKHTDMVLIENLNWCIQPNQHWQLSGPNGSGKTAILSLITGDQRLLLIARAMVKHPPLLILDVPCLGLDEINHQLVLALIEKVCAAKETSVIYINHHAQDRIAGIDHYLALEKSADNA